MTNWAIRLPRECAHAVAALRNVPRVEVCSRAEQLWCRGETIDDPIASRLRRLPGAWRFSVLEDGQLVPTGEHVPTEQLPEGPWLRVSDWLRLQLPDAAASRVEFERSGFPTVPLTLVPSDFFQQPTVLRTSLKLWHTYGSEAPAVRLTLWSFAMRRDGQCLIRGAPLPPIAGTQIVETDGLLVPAGWTWSPHVEPTVIHELLELQSGDMALFNPAGAWELIRTHDWVRATRSAIRMSANEVEHGRNRI